MHCKILIAFCVVASCQAFSTDRESSGLRQMVNINGQSYFIPKANEQPKQEAYKVNEDGTVEKVEIMTYSRPNPLPSLIGGIPKALMSVLQGGAGAIGNLLNKLLGTIGQSVTDTGSNLAGLTRPTMDFQAVIPRFP